jgi:hypothetical protein
VTVTGTQKLLWLKKLWFLTWAHELTESRMKGRHPASIMYLSFALSHSLLQSFCSHLGIQEGQDWK